MNGCEAGDYPTACTGSALACFWTDGSREDDGLQVEFMGTIHGIRSFEGVRARATMIELDGVPLRVALLEDIIRSKKEARRPRELAVIDVLEKALEESSRQASKARRARPRSERALRALIRHWQALPPAWRTHFLRKRIAPGRSTL